MKYYVPDWLKSAVRFCRRDNARFSEEGDTLIEVLIAIVILGMASVALLVSFATSITASGTYRDVATLDTVLRSASEEVITQIQQQPAALFESCGGAADVTFSLPTGYTAAITSVSYWNGAAFQSTCVPNAEQWISLSVTETQNGRTASNNFIVDDPLARPIAIVGAATQLVYIEQPGSSSINSPLTPEPVVAIEDASGNIVTTDLSPVTLVITPGTGTSGAHLSASCSGTEFYGVVTFSSCMIDTAGAGYTLSASDGTLTTATSSAFTVSTGVPTQLVFATQPGSSTGSSTLSTQPVLNVEDAYGFLVTNDNSTVSLAITPSTGSSGAALSGCAQTESSGVVTFLGCAVSLAGNGYTLTASDGSLASVISTSFNVTVGAAAKLVFTTQPTANASGNALTSEPVVKVEDAAGNVVTSSSTAITLSASGGSLSSCAGLVANAGVVTVSGCVFSGLVDTNYTLSASTSGLITGVSASFTVTVGEPAKLVFSSATNGVASASASSPFTTQPVVNVEDAAGNVVTNYVGVVTLSLNAGETLSCSSGNSATPTNGVVSFTGCAGSAYASGVTLTASSAGLASATSASFDISNVATQLAFTTQPVTTADGASITPSVVVSVEDSSGMVVTTSSASIALVLGTNPGSGALSGTSPVSAVDGSATFSDLSINALGSGYTLSATSTALAPVTSSGFNVVVGAPAKLVFITEPVGGASGATLATQPVVKVEDSAGNVVTSASTTISLTASGGTLASCAGLTASSGVVNVTGCTFAGLVGTNFTLGASATGLAAATSSTFSPSIYGSATKLVFATQPVGGASGATLATQPVVKVEDSAGNVVTSASTTISLTASGGTLASCGGLTAASGVVNVTGCTFAGLVGTNYTLSAKATGLTTATSSTFSPSTFGTAAKLVFTTQPGSGASGVILPTQPVVKVEDSAGNVVTSASTAITLSASGGTLASCTGLTASSGVVNVTGCT
ncbi:MAG TPA: type II secretion system protein, partial [Acidimicrobiales bacterium]|nr:type II secretion system protein [Acidimicrobiales bacterium]HVB52564.1 type II secretion system protein [Acidimicrobiales bacterium]